MPNNKRFIKNKLVYLSWVFVILLLIPLVNLGIYKHELPKLELQTYNNLQSIANIKVQQMTRWLNYRVADASVLASDRQLSEDIASQIRAHDALSAKIIKARFESLISSYHYESVSLLNINGAVVLQTGESLSKGKVSDYNVDQNLIKEVKANYQTRHGDFFIDYKKNLTYKS
ncbi:MAG: cache domain-containing protein [Bacteroidia bacterium]|nr:cache domain-containing protein [Methylotenera sp.]